MDIDKEGRLAYWVYCDTTGQVFDAVDPDAGLCKASFIRQLFKFLYGRPEYSNIQME